MNVSITQGLDLMPPVFADGLSVWSSGNGTPGSATYDGAVNAAYVPSDQHFGGCIELLKTDAAAPRAVTDRVFDAFDKGGAGPLAAWIILSGDVAHLEPVRDAVCSLVEAIVGQSTDEGAQNRVRAAVLMMAVSAFGDAVIGPYLRDMLDQKDDAMRDLMARILPLFLLPSGIPPAVS